MMKRVLFSICFSMLSFLTAFSQWQAQNSATNQDLWGISFADEVTGYAGGGPWQFTSSGVITKTEDGGQTWVSQSPVAFPSCIFGVEAVNQDTVFAVGCNATSTIGLILRSFDGGGSWTVKNISTTWGFYCVEFPTESVGYTCGWNGRIYKTINAGDSWTSQPTGSVQTFRRMHFINDVLGFVGCGSDHATTNKIYKTTNGTSWSMIKNFGSSFIIGGLYFFDENTGVVAGTNGSKAVIKRTTDGGSNWDDVLTGTYSFVLECLYFDGDTGWAAGKYGSSNGIFRSIDRGETWELHSTNLTGTPYSVFKVDTASYICGTSGMIMKFTEEISTRVDEKKAGKIEIYPNPSYDKITIDLSGFAGKINLEIFDSSGQAIKRISGIDRERIELNVSGWTRGVYCVKVWSNNWNFDSEKIIIN